jgi:hypothetical protein
MLIYLVPSFGQVVRTNGDVQTYLATITLATLQSGMVSEYYVRFGSDGLCKLGSGTNEAVVFWPATERQGGRTFDNNMTLTIKVTDLSNQSLRFAPLVTTLERDLCPAGFSYFPPIRCCLACLPSQYGI